MTPHQIAALGIRLFTIWFFLSSVTSIIGYYSLARGAEDVPFLVILSISFTVVACFLMWFYSFAIARKMLPGDANPDISKPIFEDWFSVGCSLIGLYACSKAIPALVSHALLALFSQRLPSDYFEMNPDWRLTVAFNVFQLAFGLWLFFGGRGLKKLLTWAKYS